jgi:antimicrobial peptide system SdpB family protein
MHLLKSTNIIKFIENKTSENPFSRTYGIGRSLLALSTLSVFLFNDIEYLFDKKGLEVLSSSEIFISKINLFGIIGYENLLIGKILAIVILFSVISGYYPKITGILHFWLMYSFHNSCLILDGGDQIATIFSFMIIPITLLDKRKNHWHDIKLQSTYSKLLGHLFFKLIALQASFIYLNTAIEKLYNLNEWKNGTAMYYIVKSEFFGVNDFFSPIFDFIVNSRTVFFLTWWIIISHLLLSYLLFLSRTKKANYIILGLFFHGGIAVFMGLYSFSLSMFGILVLYLLPFNLKKWNLTKYFMRKSSFSTGQ